MKRIITLALLLLPLIAFGQAVRYNGTVYTINSSAPLPGALYPVLASASATVNICNAPAAGFTVLNAATQSISNGCTNFATTYTNSSQSSTCSAPTQLTRTNSTACVGNVDGEGTFGAWLPAGTYQYTVTLSYGSFGPYDFSVGGTGGGGGGGDVTGGIDTDNYITPPGNNGISNTVMNVLCLTNPACFAVTPSTSTSTGSAAGL